MPICETHGCELKSGYVADALACKYCILEELELERMADEIWMQGL